VPLVSDDYHAIQSSAVECVTKPSDPSAWDLTVWLVCGLALTLWFDTSDTRDEFYKRLVDAMSQ
jgi:hypothetical protein